MKYQAQTRCRIDGVLYEAGEPVDIDETRADGLVGRVIEQRQSAASAGDKKPRASGKQTGQASAGDKQ